MAAATAGSWQLDAKRLIAMSIDGYINILISLASPIAAAALQEPLREIAAQCLLHQAASASV